MSRVVGFDFGTTNSLISIVEGGRVVSLLEKGLPHPSVICYQGGQVIVGRKAKERLATSDVGVIGNIVKSPKSLLGEHKVFVEGVARSPKEMVADIVRHVKEHAKGQEPGDYERAVVTIPVDMNGERRSELRDAFRMAGINIVQFIHEPLAALYGHLKSLGNFDEEIKKLNRELILVFDWGGGTLDLTLCQIVEGLLVQIMNDGCSHIGGDKIDSIILNEIVKRTLQSRGIESELPQQPNAAQRLLERAERAKIELSTRESYTVFVPDYFASDEIDKDIEYSLKRTELEDMVKKEIRDGVQRVESLLSKAGVNPSAIALCLATGGMVNMPIIKSRLREIFGPQRLHVSARGNTVISEGAAWIAHDKAPLSLAKNVEFVVAPNTYFPVLKAGVKMPREGEVQKIDSLSLYCTDPRDGIAKIQIASPIKPGRKVQKTDERMVLDVMSIEVDAKAKPFLERIVVDMEIDEDLILRSSAKSLVKGDSDSLEIHNLEFGLDLFTETSRADQEEDMGFYVSNNAHKAGSVSLRPNISERMDNALVPGELMYLLNPEYFDRRLSPPEHQDQEKLYYQPCSICKRPSNHPLCKCAQSLYGGTN